LSIVLSVILSIAIILAPMELDWIFLFNDFLSFQQANLLRAALTIKLEDKRWKRMRLKWRRIQQNFVMMVKMLCFYVPSKDTLP